MRRTTPVVLLAVGLAIAGCSSPGAEGAKASSVPASVDASPSLSTDTLGACEAVLETNYEDGNVHNASGDPGCRNLTSAEYQKAVKDVLSKHVGDIVSSAADQALYDETWDSLDSDARRSTCDLLASNGPKAVGETLKSLVQDASVDTTAMAEYFYKKKC